MNEAQGYGWFAINCSDRIKQLRQQNDFSTGELAVVLRIKEALYTDYENGTVRVPVKHLIHLAKFYNVNMDYLCGYQKQEGTFLGG